MDRKKRGIVLGGGGAKGSFQVGALQYIHELEQQDEHPYETVLCAGTSVGALNSALFCLNEIDLMKSIWRSVSDSNSFYPNWKLGKTKGILFENSIYSNSWLIDAIDNCFNSFDEKKDFKTIRDSRKIKNMIVVSTDLLTGQINSQFIDTNLFLDLGWRSFVKNQILASASLHPIFPPVKVNGMMLVDGGLREPIPVKELIEYESKLDQIIIIPAGVTTISNTKKNDLNFIETIARSVDIMLDSVTRENITRGKKKYWDEDNKFILLEPDSNLIETLDTDNEKIKRYIQHGYYIADCNQEILCR